MSNSGIIPAATPPQMEQVRRLFREYAEATGACECFQGFAHEVAGLPGPYAPPTGQLLLARADTQPAGCVALRRIDVGFCEMKRLYVRPEFRGRSLGRELDESILCEARRIGYHAMRLDTLSSMTAARALYLSLGFQIIPRYNDNPSPDALYFELAL